MSELGERDWDMCPRCFGYSMKVRSEKQEDGTYKYYIQCMECKFEEELV